MKRFKRLTLKMKKIYIVLGIETLIITIIGFLSIFRVGVFCMIGDWIRIVSFVNLVLITVFLSIVSIRGKKSNEKVKKEDENT